MGELLKSFSLSVLRPSRWQARTSFPAAGLAELAGSIRKNGLINPLIVWIDEDGQPELLAGERRTRAMMCLAFVDGKVYPTVDAAAEFCSTHGPEIFFGDEYPLLPHIAYEYGGVSCRVVTGHPAILQEIALIDNLQRADLDPLDEARGLAQMIAEHSYTQRQLAEKINKSQTYVQQRLVLLELAPEVSARVVAGELDPASAREIARLDPAVHLTVANRVREQHLSSRQARNVVAKIVEFAKPEYWSADGQQGESAMALQLTRGALEQKTPAERQAAMATWTMAGDKGRAVPTNEYEWRPFLNVLGINPAQTTVQDVWREKGTELTGRSCDNCAFLPFRARLQALLRSEAGHFWYRGYPLCGKITDAPVLCSMHTATPDIQWTIPAGDREGRVIPPEPEPAVTGHSYHEVTVRGIEPGLAIGEALMRQERVKEVAKQQVVQTGMADAITLYVAEQPNLSAVPWSQPCSACLFSQPGATAPAHACQWQDQEFSLSYASYGMPTAGYEHFLALWSDGERTIGRCGALFKFRARDFGLGYAWAIVDAGIRASEVVRMAILKQVCLRESYNDKYHFPPWLNAAAGEHPGQWIPWEDAAKALRPLVKDMSQGQVLALWSLNAASRNLPMGAKLGQKADVLDPFTGHWQHWQCTAVFGRGVDQRAQPAAAASSDPSDPPDPSEIPTL